MAIEEGSINIILRTMTFDILVERRKEKMNRGRKPILMLLLVSFIAAFVTMPKVQAGTINVNNGMTTAQINSAIASAVSGDVVQFAPGTYSLTTSLVAGVAGVTLQGDIANPGNVIIDAGTIPANSGPKPPGRDRDAFQVVANNVAIKGFKIINAWDLMTGAGDGWQNNGITVGGDITLIDWLEPYNKPILIDGGTFSNNIIENCSNGIYLAMSKNVVVSYNTIRTSSTYTRADAGTGIINWNTKAWGAGNWQDPTNNMIENNVLEYNERTGICLGAWDPDLFTVSGTVIRGNIIQHNSRRAIDLMYITGPLLITKNDICSNGAEGIRVLYNVSGAEAFCNNIYDNTNFGVNVYDLATASLYAENNWWGSATGPYHPTAHPSGLGDTVTDNVDFEPWSVYYPSCTQPVGGEWVPINAAKTLVQLVGSALALSAIAASFVGFKRTKKRLS